MRHGSQRRASPGIAAAWLALAAAGAWIPGTAAADPEVVVRADWGSAPGQLGRRGGDESAPEGPMSFAVAPDGGVWVLDQVNRRVVRFGGDGAYRDELPIGSDTF